MSVQLQFLKLIDMEKFAISFFNELRYLYKNGYKRIIGKYTYDYWNNAVSGDKELDSYEEELKKANNVTKAGWIIIGILFVIIIIIRLLF